MKRLVAIAGLAAAIGTSVLLSSGVAQAQDPGPLGAVGSAQGPGGLLGAVGQTPLAGATKG